MLVGDIGLIRDVDRRSGRRLKATAPGQMIGMVVRLQDVLDLEPVLVGEREVVLDLPLRVDDSCLAAVGDDVGRAAKIVVQDLTEEHWKHLSRSRDYILMD